MKFRIFKLAGLLVAAHAVAPGQSQDELFTGPNILSRGTKPIGRSGGRPIRFRAYAGVGVSYSGGLTSATTDSKGNLPDESSYGGYANFGLYGAKAGRRSQGSVSYSGNFELFNKSTYHSGLNQALSAHYSTQLNRRASFFIGVSASQTNTNLGLVRTPFVNEYVDQPQDPNFEIFDSPSYNASLAGGISYRLSSRWSIAGQGSTYLVRRRSIALVNSNGWNAGAQASYRLDRKSSVGASYSYGQFYFQRSFGESKIMTTMGNYSRSLSRNWSLGASAGVFRIESDRLVTVAIDPVIAALLGQYTVSQAFHGVNSGLSVSASANGRFRKSSVSLTYSRGANPGNGLYLTSVADTGGVNYSYSGIKRVGIFANAGVGRMKAVLEAVDNLKPFRYESAGAGMSLRIAPFIHFTTSAAVGSSAITSSAYGRTRYYVSSGITFSPGDIPLILW